MIFRCSMKKLSTYLFFVLLFCEIAIAASKDGNAKLDQLFNQLKESNNASIALKIEIEIWNIWSTHPTKDKLTQSLAHGSDVMSEGKFETAYKIFSTIIAADPKWAEGWNKRATVLYLMGKYQASLNDIDEVLKRESRHFGALSGQALVHIELQNYEQALKSYQTVQKIYPSIRAAKIMIPQLQELIKGEDI